MASWKLVVADECYGDLASALAGFISDFDTSPNAMKGLSSNYYLWKIKNNAAGRGYITLAFDKGKIVGSATATRKQIRFGGETVPAVEMGDTFTVPDYQRQGIFSALVNATRERAMSDGVMVLYGFPNQSSLQGYEKKCNFSRKENIDLWSYTLPLRASPIAQELLIRTKLGNRWKTGKSIDNLTDFFLKHLCSIKHKAKIHATASFDESFNHLDAEISKQYHFMLPRRAVDLKFRIQENPEQNKFGLITDSRQGGELTGFAIYKTSVSIEGVRPRIALADIAFLDHRTFRTIWNTLISHAMNIDCHSIILLAEKSFNTTLRMLPLIAVPRVKKELIFFKSELGKELITDNGRWHLSLLDYDGI